MDISLTFPRGDFDQESFAVAAARLAELLDDHAHLRLIVTTDFVAAVREAIAPDDPEYAAAYEQERDFAFAIAKTISNADGTVDLIVDARLFSFDAEAADALRSFEHEALHILVERRGESMNDLRARRGQSRYSAAGTFSAITGVACEEYRVERAIWNMHPEARDNSHLAEFHTAVERFEEHVRAASIRYQRDLNVEAISRAVMEAFHALSTSTAYVAAEMDARCARAIAVPADRDEFVLGAPWQAVVAALQRLPPADQHVARDELERLADTVMERLAEWLEYVGFRLSDLDDGSLHFAVLNPEQWVSWSDVF